MCFSIPAICKTFSRVVISGLLGCAMYLAMHYSLVPLQNYLEDRMLDDVVLGFLCGAGCYLYLNNLSAQRQLRRDEERLKLFVKYTPAAVAMMDREMRYLLASDRWLHDYQITEADITGKSHYEVFPEITRMPAWLNDHQRCLTYGESIHRDEDSFVRLSGKREWLNYDIIPWYESNKNIGGLLFFTEVVTARKEAMMRLQESEARFQRAMRGSNDGIWDWEIQSGQIYYSPQFKRLLGYEPEDLGDTLQSWAELLHPEDYAATMDKIDDHLKQKTPIYSAEYRLKNKSGEYVWFEARGRAEWDERDTPLRMAGSLVDISERKRLEKLKHEFVYVVTHELRTPLMALRGSLEMLPLLLGKDLPSKVEKMLDLAMQGCSRLNLLVNDLQEAGKAESGAVKLSMAKVDAARLLQGAVELNQPYADNYHIKLHLHCHAQRTIINIDPDRFMQVLANLLSNAAKFSTAGSHVTVTATNQDNTLRIAVEDHGEGIPQELQNRIFQKFVQGNKDKPGTGLGLNITKTFVERMNGKIWFESVPEQGTTFFIEFPLA